MGNGAPASQAHLGDIAFHDATGFEYDLAESGHGIALDKAIGTDRDVTGTGDHIAGHETIDADITADSHDIAIHRLILHDMDAPAELDHIVPDTFGEVGFLDCKFLLSLLEVGLRPFELLLGLI